MSVELIQGGVQAAAQSQYNSHCSQHLCYHNKASQIWRVKPLSDPNRNKQSGLFHESHMSLQKGRELHQFTLIVTVAKVLPS